MKKQIKKDRVSLLIMSLIYLVTVNFFAANNIELALRLSTTGFALLVGYIYSLHKKVENLADEQEKMNNEKKIFKKKRNYLTR